MDEYGIGSAAAMGVHLFERASRGTGRTTRMVDVVHNDDLIVCRTGREAERIRRLLKERGKTTRVAAVENADDLDRIGPRVKGRMHFDHEWVYAFITDAIRSAEDDLKRISDRFSSVPRDRSAELRHPMNAQRRGEFPTRVE